MAWEGDLVDQDVHAKRTPLYDWHVGHGGRMVEFGGWELPVQYDAGIVAEHLQVRAKAGLFDVSHMGKIMVSGPGAKPLVQWLITNDVDRYGPGQALYSPMCWPSGGVVDDLLVYPLGPEQFLLVVNAANTDKDLDWISQEAQRYDSVAVENITASYAQAALQGPLAASILQRLTDFPLESLGSYEFADGVEVAGISCLVSRTGYTGEDGFEIYLPAGQGEQFWEALVAAAKPGELLPCGLGARDTLRFEARMPLYGQELDDETTPLEAGLGRFVRLDKPAFSGREALQAEKAGGLRKKLAGFRMVDRGIARHGYRVFHDGQPVGIVTSGSFAPSVGQNLGLAYLPPALTELGTTVYVEVRGKPLAAEIIRTPFYRPAPPGLRSQAGITNPYRRSTRHDSQ